MSQERFIYWGSGSTPAWKALIGLEEKKLSYESKVVEFSKGKPRRRVSAPLVMLPLTLCTPASSFVTKVRCLTRKGAFVPYHTLDH